MDTPCYGPYHHQTAPWGWVLSSLPSWFYAFSLGNPSSLLQFGCPLSANDSQIWTWDFSSKLWILSTGPGIEKVLNNYPLNNLIAPLGCPTGTSDWTHLLHPPFPSWGTALLGRAWIKSVACQSVLALLKSPRMILLNANQILSVPCLYSFNWAQISS